MYVPVAILAFAACFYLTRRFGIAGGRACVCFLIGVPVIMLLTLLFLGWLGLGADHFSSDDDCEKWNWATGECIKKPRY